MNSSNIFLNCCLPQLQFPQKNTILVDNLSPIRILSHHCIPNYQNHNQTIKQNIKHSSNYKQQTKQKISIKLKRIKNYKQLKTQQIRKVNSQKIQILQTARFKQPVFISSTQSFNKKQTINIATNQTNQSPQILSKIHEKHTQHNPHYFYIYSTKNPGQVPQKPYCVTSQVFTNQISQNKPKIKFNLLNSNIKHSLITNNHHSNNIQQQQKIILTNYSVKMLQKSIKHPQIVQKKQPPKNINFIKYNSIQQTLKQQDKKIRLSNSIKSIDSYLCEVNQSSIDRKIQQSVIMVDFFNPAKNLNNKWNNFDKNNLLIH